MKVAVVSELGLWSASTRYRLVQHLDRLGARVGTVDLLLPDDRPQRAPGRRGQVEFFASHVRRYGQRAVDLRRRLPGYDAVLVQRGVYPMGPALAAGAIEHHQGRIVFDLDDDVFSPKPAMVSKSAAARWLYGPQQAARVLARADQVVVSTAVLGQSVQRSGSTPVTVLPTVPDPARYCVAEHTSSRRVIGWAGTNGGLPYLDPLAEVVANIERDRVGHLEVVSSEPWSGPSMFRRWRLEDEYTLFTAFAVGIMPLPDTEYTRAKAGFKLLQYMAAGVPVVASPIGVNRELVTESGAGLLAEGPEEWDDALRRLLGDVGLRRRLGECGRQFVAGYADMEGQADTLAGLLTAT